MVLSKQYKRNYNNNKKKLMSKLKGKTTRKGFAVRRPARLRVSTINYTINKAVAKAVNGVAENKITPLTSFNETAPSAIQTGAVAYTKSFTVGSIPTVWSGTSGLSALSGMTFAQGTQANQCTGKYIYLQKTHFTLEIDMSPLVATGIPVEFRVICFKARRGNNPQGISNRYDTSLFLSPAGSDVGHDTSGITGSDLLMQPLNKKDWDIRSDKKFMLSNPSVSATDPDASAYSGKYACMKRLVYNLPFYSKTELVANSPADLDTNYVVVIYARSLGKDFLANKFEVTTRGSTTFKDM